MVDSSSSLFSSPGTLEMGRFRAPWREHEPFCDYIDDLFPRRADSSALGEGSSSDRFADMKYALRASKLKKTLRLTLRRTHDLRDHLQFDRKHKILDIFHMTTFLKEQLRHSKETQATSSDAASSVEDPCDILPHQLLLETLASIQQILFPPSDRRSRHLLRTLISSAGFDPDAARYESATIRPRGGGGDYTSSTSSGATPLRYVYLAERLEDLYEETLNPPPDGWLDQVLERKSGKRHVMCITIAGFVVALLLGVLSLVAGVFQAVIAYLAWKNP
ncbi:hypothetical protein NLG97_g10581 [Lecanicillium saksenae]|uniref:Uncharacterized protein n=1 Tax=Lecanicillium saksenae TaxID=468837 RepID=A0ACC1QEL2_9HYPO|nr:hypothetical protein NLG97_g10581 [Lecanicillium saksenae]